MTKTQMNEIRKFYMSEEDVLLRDEKSDAIAYVHDNSYGFHCATVFFGRCCEPEISICFETIGQRDAEIAYLFAKRQAWKAERAA